MYGRRPGRFGGHEQLRREQLNTGISTNHRPDGGTAKPEPAPGLSRVIRSAPQWVLRSPDWLRLAGAQPYLGSAPTRGLEGFSPLTGGSSGRRVSKGCGPGGGALLPAAEMVRGWRLKRLAEDGLCSADGVVTASPPKRQQQGAAGAAAAAASAAVIDLTGDDDDDGGAGGGKVEQQRRSGPGGKMQQRRQQQRQAPPRASTSATTAGAAAEAGGKAGRSGGSGGGGGAVVVYEEVIELLDDD